MTINELTVADYCKKVSGNKKNQGEKEIGEERKLAPESKMPCGWNTAKIEHKSGVSTINLGRGKGKGKKQAGRGTVGPFEQPLAK